MAGKPVAASCRCGAVCAGFPGVARPDCLGWVAVRAGGRRPARFPMLLVAPRVFRVPSGPAAREIATREPSARSRRSRSPAKPSGPSSTLHTGGVFIAVHIPSRPRRPRAPPPSPTARPLSSRSSRVALHTGGAWCAGGDRRRFEARLCPAAASGYRSWAPAGGCMPCVGFQSGPLGGLQHEDLAGGVSPTCRTLV